MGVGSVVICLRESEKVSGRTGLHPDAFLQLRSALETICAACNTEGTISYQLHGLLALDEKCRRLPTFNHDLERIVPELKVDGIRGKLEYLIVVFGLREYANHSEICVIVAGV
jgi:hypothetical protein